ncbi:hypothetical protein RKE38_17220 [Phycicoccus sp. M110.8]|uniref:hypothetical protein n=1 Tax=Phycicoccus sp. M110.8 TaxID=3075433 RepID=UPI0028FD02D6|nr:hypothetical protein [Phycicoccus sp. M110.8]MDU0315443.1 hypothetical protein [Phycicoccus sp. M110.8]
MRRTVAVACGVIVGAALGFVVGTVAADMVNDARTRMDEAEYIFVGLLGAVVAPFVGALVGGVVGARVERRL